MSAWRRLALTLWSGMLAAMIAHDAGVPWWNPAPFSAPGDASDIGMATGMIVLILSGARRAA